MADGGSQRGTGGRSRRDAAYELAVIFLLGTALLRWTYGRAEGVPGNDSFYHVKMASLLPEHGLMTKLPWLRFVYFTDEGDDFVSHHYGFHAVLAPFVLASKALTGDPLEGAKWAMSGFFGLNLALFAAVLRVCGVRGRWFWLVLFLLMPHHYFTRHSFVRAIAPSMSCMLLVVLALFRQRPVWLGLAVAAYIHLYLGGLLYAPLLVGAFVAGSLLAGQSEGTPAVGEPAASSRLWRLVAGCAAGVALGVASHPYAGGIVEFLRLQVFGTGLSPDISVGQEWKPYEGAWWFAQMTGFVLGAWLVALGVRLRFGRPADGREMTLLFVHVGFLVLTLKARRFVEYWPVFCLLSAASLARPWLDEALAAWESRVGARWSARGRAWVRWGGSATCAAGGLSIVLFAPQWKEIFRANKCEFDLPAIQSAMTILREQSDAGDVVFTDDWDLFPVFFYYNSHNHYIVGLDPKFTHHRDAVLWERYVKVSRGQVPADLSVKVRDSSGVEQTVRVAARLEDIRDHFGARFVITDREHKALAGKLAAAAEFAELIYPSTEYAPVREAPYLVFRVRP